jgi:hypothetical protein
MGQIISSNRNYVLMSEHETEATRLDARGKTVFSKKVPSTWHER